MQKKEQLYLIKGKDRINNKTSSNRISNNKIKMQQDSDIYIYTSLILNQNFQENQKKMQRHIYYASMIG